MNFQGALTLLKEGKKLRRKAWQFFAFVRVCDQHLEIGDIYSSGPWRPTGDDLFAADWEVYQPEPESVQLAGLTGSLRVHGNGLFEWRDPTDAVRVTMSTLAEALRYAKPQRDATPARRETHENSRKDR